MTPLKPIDHRPALSHLRAETQATIDRIARSTLNAFTSVLSEPPGLSDDTAGALIRAPLKGLPIAVKEVIDVAGSPCGYGCLAFEDRIPLENAEIVDQLIGLGAQVIGITRSTEMAIAKPTITVNPWSPGHSPGGSSSGSAAAVGAGLVSFALGTQTIGSVIRPAAYCGAVGFKPTHGIGSLKGVLSLSPTLDHLGFFADTLERMTGVLHLLMSEHRQQPSASFRWVFVEPWFQDQGLKPFFRLREQLRRSCKGTGIDSADLILPTPITREEAEITDTLLCVEMFRTWGDSLLGHPGTSDLLQGFLRRGQSIADANYQRSLERRQTLIDHLESLLGDGDVIVFPSVMGPPPRLEQGTGSRDPQRLWTLLGMPALNLPLGQSGGFPINLQLIAKRGADRHLLESAAIIRQHLIQSPPNDAPP
ncbi:amidase family protein [Mangrovitalea sediminis]|uniref:amidase family protein n=1 Tax=Mangrovitalea sediminis TaxID=1982043 RepID=UPI000BE5ACD0|nr:amidase [Mangrovitalea sediminis]